MSSLLRSRRSSLHPVLLPQRHFRAAQEVGVNHLTHPLAGGSLAAWSIPLQTQVMSPTSPTPPAVRIQSTRRSTFPTGTKISGAQTTSHDVHQCRRHAEFRSIKQQPQSRSKQSVVPCSVILDSRSWRQGNWRRVGESVATTIFSSLWRGKRYRDTNVVHALRDRENPQKILERKVGLVVQGQKDAQQKLYQAEAETEAKKVGKSEIGTILFREINQEFESQQLQLHQSESMGRSGSER